MKSQKATVAEAVGRALRLISEHPAFGEIISCTLHRETGTTEVEVVVRPSLPNAWMADGGSPNGVRAVEPVTLIFFATFPLRAPLILLRADFDRSLAHVFPGSPDERPVPCIYDGSLVELLQQRGFSEILNQLVLWLENAALGQLINQQQGWEPVRRDNLEDFIVADAGHLRSLVSIRTNYAVLGFNYLRSRLGTENSIFHGEVGRDILKVYNRPVFDLFGERPLPGHRDAAFGMSLAILAWPGNNLSGEAIAADQYLPETVTDFVGLMQRAERYGCAASLRNAIDWLERYVKAVNLNGRLPIAVILCARRPFHLIGSSSELELCPYLIEIGMPRLLPEEGRTRVRPAGHRHKIAAALLREMSGDDKNIETLPWIQVGAGSLGSKIALHLARAGRGPKIIVDPAGLSPHNAARHGLVPGGPMQGSWMESKAVALAEAVRGLGQQAEACLESIIDITRDVNRAKRAVRKEDWAIVNSTASLAVREALASVPVGIAIPRTVETSLFAGGRVGLFSVEGPERNPNIGDLITEAYALFREDPELRRLVFTDDDTLRRQVVGEGCGSATMVMSDARISMLAAPMAEILLGMQRTGFLGANGYISLGVVAEDRISQSWRSFEVEQWQVVAVDRRPTWFVRLNEQAHRKILDEVAQWPTVETGGILVGRFSETAQTFYVVDVFPAPVDSRRSAAEFVLGTTGLRAALNAYSESSNYSLYCLGTWHSHLVASGPSALDKATATAVALARLMPSVLLIHTPVGYRALLAEPAASDELMKI